MSKMIRIYYFLIFVLLFNDFLLGKNKIENNEEKINLLFQELNFNMPTDNYFIIEFDIKSGISRLKEKLNYQQAINLYGEYMKQKNIPFNQYFKLWYSQDLRCSFLYGKQNDSKYESVLFDDSKNEIIKKFEFIPNWSVNENLFYFGGFFETRIYKISSLNPITRKEDLFFKYDTSSNYYTDSFILYDNFFYSFGYYIIKTKKDNFSDIIKRKKAGGIITHSGLVAKNWGWFYWRFNEKCSGYLGFINLDDLKIKKCKTDMPQCQLIKIIS